MPNKQESHSGLIWSTNAVYGKTTIKEDLSWIISAKSDGNLNSILNRKPDKKLKPKKLARIRRFGVVFDTKNAKPHFIFFSS